MSDHTPSFIAHEPMTRRIDLKGVTLKREPTVADAIREREENRDAIARRLLPKVCERDWLKHRPVAVAEGEAVATETGRDFSRRAVGRAQHVNFNAVALVSGNRIARCHKRAPISVERCKSQAAQVKHNGAAFSNQCLNSSSSRPSSSASSKTDKTASAYMTG